jgi:hypothetical protein
MWLAALSGLRLRAGTGRRRMAGTTTAVTSRNFESAGAWA